MRLFTSQTPAEARRRSSIMAGIFLTVVTMVGIRLEVARMMTISLEVARMTTNSLEVVMMMGIFLTTG